MVVYNLTEYSYKFIIFHLFDRYMTIYLNMYEYYESIVRVASYSGIIRCRNIEIVGKISGLNSLFFFIYIVSRNIRLPCLKNIKLIVNLINDLKFLLTTL